MCVYLVYDCVQVWYTQRKPSNLVQTTTRQLHMDTAFPTEHTQHTSPLERVYSSPSTRSAYWFLLDAFNLIRLTNNNAIRRWHFRLCAQLVNTISTWDGRHIDINILLGYSWLLARCGAFISKWHDLKHTEHGGHSKHDAHTSLTWRHCPFPIFSIPSSYPIWCRQGDSVTVG